MKICFMFIENKVVFLYFFKYSLKFSMHFDISRCSQKDIATAVQYRDKFQDIVVKFDLDIQKMKV